MESLASPVASERETQAQTGQDTQPVMTEQCVEDSPLPPDSEDPALLCPSPQIQDAGTSSSAAFSPPSGPEMTRPETPVSPPIATQSHTDPQVQYQVPQQLQVSQALFAQNQALIPTSVSQPLPQIHMSASQPLSSVSSSSPLHVSVSVPKQQPDPTAVSASVSKGGDAAAVQQHTHSEFNPLLKVRLNMMSFSA